jgi:putative protein kinase ArgK-like GTPase of G3E family
VEGQGLDALEEAVRRHQNWLDHEGRRQKKQEIRLRLRLEARLTELWMQRVNTHINEPQWQSLLSQLSRGEMTLHDAAERLAQI